MRKLIVVAGVACALAASTGVASATDIPLGSYGRSGCEVRLGTVGVLEPDGAVTYDGFAVDPYFCLPPP